MQVIASSCPGLRALDVSYSPHITAAGLGQLLGACANLEELDISACPGKRDTSGHGDYQSKGAVKRVAYGFGCWPVQKLGIHTCSAKRVTLGQGDHEVKGAVKGVDYGFGCYLLQKPGICTFG